MRIECFSRGKRFAAPEENEDSVVVLPGRGYAVIDGVTDRSGRRFAGMRAGRFASGLVAAEVARFLLGEDLATAGGGDRARRLIARLGETLREGYAAQGLTAQSARDPATRIGCTLALAMHDGDALQVVAIGDSGVRLSGPDIGAVRHVEAKPLDRVTALIRRETWAFLEATGVDRAMRRTIARDAAWRGLCVAPPGIDDDATAAIRARVLRLCDEEAPAVDRGDLNRLIDRGINGQRIFANHPDSDLGYGVLDGFDIPERHIFSAAYPVAGISRLELFSDGYFAEPDAFGVAAWEAAFAEVERIDPDKVGRYASVKGSTPDAWTDDRTYLGVEFDRPGAASPKQAFPPV